MADDSKPRSAVLFHGLTGSVDEMHPLARYLEQRGFNVCVPALPGHAGGFEMLTIVHAQEWLSCAEDCVKSEYSRAGMPVHVVGLSMGSLLALHAAAIAPSQVASAVALSPPLLLRSRIEDGLLRLAAYLPEHIVARLRIARPKSKRAPNCLAIPHRTTPEFPLNAAIRFAKVRKRVVSELSAIHCQVFVCYDPDDHLIHPAGLMALRRAISPSHLSERSFPGGQHELTLGHSYPQVYEAAYQFLLKQ